MIKSLHLHLGQQILASETKTYIKHLRHPTTTITGGSSIHDEATSSFISSVVDRHELADDNVLLGGDPPPNLLLATTDSAVLPNGSTLALLPFLFLIFQTSNLSRGFFFFVLF